MSCTATEERAGFVEIDFKTRTSQSGGSGYSGQASSKHGYARH